MADTTAMDPSLFSYLKSQLPGAKDEDIIAGWQQAEKQQNAQGRSLKDVPPEQFAQAFKAGLAAQGQVPQPAPTQSLAPVTVTGKATTPDQTIAAMPTTPGAPTAGGQPLDALYGGKGPTANRLNASDPALMNDAAAQLYQKQGGNSALRQFTNAAAAAVQEGLGGSKGAILANQKRQDEMDAAATTGAVKSAQELGSKGLSDANSALTASTNATTAANQLQMDKAKFVVEQQGRGLSLEQAQTAWDEVGSKLYDKQGPLAKITQDLAAKALGVESKTLDGLSPAELNGVVQHSKPTTDLQNQAQTQFQNIYNGVTSRIGAVAGANQANAGAAATNLGTTIVGNATQGGKVVPPNMNLSVGAGPASMSPSPAVTAVQQGGANSAVDLRKGVQHYDQTGVGTATDTALQALSYASLKDTGVPGQYLSKLPTAQAQSIKAALIGQQMAASPGMDAASASANAEAFMKSGTPTQLRQQLALGKANQAANKSVVLPAQEAYLQQHGSLQGFNEPSVGKFWNPRTGAVTISTDPAADGATLSKNGFVPITGVK